MSPESHATATEVGLWKAAANNPGESQGATQGKQDYGSLSSRRMRYSLLRALSLDSVDGCTPSKIPVSFIGRATLEEWGATIVGTHVR
jgi:hypothetical protein